MKTPQDILEFWFSDEVKEKWYAKDPDFDEEIRQKFLSTHERGEQPEWTETPEGSLAQVILFDQFSRNMFRDTPQAFAFDDLARKIARDAIKKNYDIELKDRGGTFFYMPFMHSENKEDQAFCVELFKKIDSKGGLDYALRHQKIIDRFGRFPHRNKILGRESTPEEKDFLAQPGSSF